MDLLMPGMDGTPPRPRFAVTRQEWCGATTSLDDDMVVAAIRAGAIGYLVKTCAATNSGGIRAAPQAACSVAAGRRGFAVKCA
jgi:DNA-binding NarL/FixJ family response regulator